MNTEKLLKQIRINRSSFEDLHITRFFSSFVAVSEGKVVKVTDPYLKYCPLASLLYDGIRKLKDSDLRLVKEEILKAVQEKIFKFGYFTERRELYRNDISVPYGASEMLMYAMRKRIIDAAVVVCDGAGTVIVNTPEIVQGIGARMNGLFLTSPIKKTIEKLLKANCHVVSPEADIEQIKGVEKAIESGYKNIAVTINGYMGENLSKLKEMETDNNVNIISLVVCATGVTKKRIQEIGEYADLVWSCASKELREIIGKKAVLQLSKAIPVFVLTGKGLGLVNGYSSDDRLLKTLDLRNQYLISAKPGGIKIRIGNFDAYLSETKLPIRSVKEPAWV